MGKQIKLFGLPIFEIRTSAETDSSNPAPWLYEAWGATPTWAGVSVNEETALKFSAIYACVRVISDQISAFPKGVYKRVDDRVREKQSAHPVQYLIDSAPNDFYSAFDMWDAVATSTLLWGNGFVEIIRDGRYGVGSLVVKHPSNIKIWYGTVDGKLVLFYEDTETQRKIPYWDMLHFHGLSYDGVQGRGVISYYAKDSVGLSIAAEKFGAKFFGNDTMMTKYLAHPSTLSDTAKKHIEESWQKNIAGLDNAFKMNVLEEGMELKNVGIPPEQAQYIATRQHQIEEICRWFKVQPHLIQHLLRSTNNNIEHQGIEFVTQTLTPWVVRFEQELNRKIFTTGQTGNYYVKFNMNSLLRGDITARTNYYAIMHRDGIMSANEIRQLEDMNPRDGGDEYLTPANITGKQDNTEDNSYNNDNQSGDEKNKAYIR